MLSAPSLLGADPLCVGAAIDGLGGRYDWLHLDIMDGHFVRNLSFGPAMARALRRRYPDVFIDAHLMVDRLDVLLPLFVEAGVSLITVHAETEPQLLHAALSSIRRSGLRAGVAMGPATGVERVRPVRLRAAEGRRYLIQMDGGINDKNVGRVALAGCDVVVAGSAVFQNPDPGAFLDAMRVKVKEALDDAGIGS